MAIRRRPGSSAGSSSSSSYVPGGRWRGFAPVRRLLDRFPGKETFGIFRFLPLFFCLGATMELVMVKWTVNGANFCEHLTTVPSFDTSIFNLIGFFSQTRPTRRGR